MVLKKSEERKEEKEYAFDVNMEKSNDDMSDD
jgi:hypothetical protein